MDLDLLILCSSQKEYERYSQFIRNEYAFIEEKIYKKKRANFLKNLLSTKIYRNKNFDEGQARNNIELEIKKLLN